MSVRTKRWTVVVGFVAMFLVSLGSTLMHSSAKAQVAVDTQEWQARSPRDEIRPQFFQSSTGGWKQRESFTISAGDSIGQHGWYQKTVAVQGGEYYRFESWRQTKRVESPRRSTPVRIVWHDENSKPVRADPPDRLANEPGLLPLAEPEHPLDQETDSSGWTKVSGVFRAPMKATKAVLELHLQWAPRGEVVWSAIAFEKTTPPASRKVRLATVHYMPSGKSPQANCEEFEPLIANAAKQKADLIVLGETVPYVRVGKKPHEVAETIPGPTTDYFGKLARTHQTHIVICLYEREQQVVYNSAVLLGSDGVILGKYRKVCLPHSEIESGVAPGNAYPVFQTKFGKVGMMICYDGFFPEVARELTNNGAEVIAWPVWGCNPLLGRARACENHVFVVSSTYTDAKANWMISAIFDHAGQTMAQGKSWGDVVVVELDLNERHFWRNNLGDFRSMVQRHRPPVSESK